MKVLNHHLVTGTCTSSGAPLPEFSIRTKVQIFCDDGSAYIITTYMLLWHLPARVRCMILSPVVGANRMVGFSTGAVIGLAG